MCLHVIARGASWLVSISFVRHLQTSLSNPRYHLRRTLKPCRMLLRDVKIAYTASAQMVQHPAPAVAAREVSPTLQTTVNALFLDMAA